MSLSSIRARVEAATPEPWHAEEIAGEPHVMFGYPFGDTIGVFNEEGDAELAAHARTDIPLLLKVAEAVHNWKEEKAQFWANAGTASYADRLLKREAEMAAALAELEAGHEGTATQGNRAQGVVR